jgi:hypothetical protein
VPGNRGHRACLGSGGPLLGNVSGAGEVYSVASGRG